MGDLGNSIANILLTQQGRALEVKEKEKDRIASSQENKLIREQEKAILEMKDKIARANATRDLFFQMGRAAIEAGADPALMKDVWDSLNDDEITRQVSGGRDIFTNDTMAATQSDQGKQANVMTQLARMMIGPMEDLSAGKDISGPARESLSRNPFIDQPAAIESASSLNRDFYNRGDQSAGVTTGAASSQRDIDAQNHQLAAIKLQKEKDPFDIMRAQAEMEDFYQRAEHYKRQDALLEKQYDQEAWQNAGKSLDRTMKLVETELGIFDTIAGDLPIATRQKMLNGLLYKWKQMGIFGPAFSPDLLMQDPSSLSRFLAKVMPWRDTPETRPAWVWVDDWLQEAELAMQAADSLSTNALFNDPPDGVTSPLDE